MSCSGGYGKGTPAVSTAVPPLASDGTLSWGTPHPAHLYGCRFHEEMLDCCHPLPKVREEGITLTQVGHHVFTQPSSVMK